MFALVGTKHALLIAALSVAVFGLSAESRAAVTISSEPTKNMNCSGGVCTPTAKNAVLNVNDLTNMLANGNVVVNTGSGMLAQQVEDIIVSAGFSWTSANSLTLDAYRSVTFHQPVSVAGTGAVVLTTDDGGTNGNLSFITNGSLSFFATSNNLMINGTVYALVNSLASLASAVAANPAGAYAFANNYDASQDGTYSQSPVPTTFTGNFEGLGNTISNVTVSARRRLSAVGGLFAEVDGGTVENVALSALSLIARLDGNAGGIVGSFGGTMFGDGVTGTLSGKAHSCLGGVVGTNGGILDNSFVTATLNPGTGCAGGLAGTNAGTISGSFATGAAGDEKGSGAGGLVGVNGGQITNSYATGAVKGGTSSIVGGLAATNEREISTSYSTGAVSGGTQSAVGGFVGNDYSNALITNSYWDTTTSGTNQGTGNLGNVQGLTGLTTQQLQAGLPAGFDPTIWAENPKINNGFPYLINNPPR